MSDERPNTGSSEHPPSSEHPWWHSGAEGLPDIESLLGPDGMAAVGGVADEALKLFVVLRDRFAVPPFAAAQESDDAQAPAWTGLLGQFASGAVRAVNEIAAAATDGQPWAAAGARGAATQESARDGAAGDGTEWPVLPGEAAACSYCPFCQAIALFRSVPMTTWQRLAGSIVEVADAARDLATSASASPVPVVVIPEPVAPQPGEEYGSIDDFLASLQVPPQDGAPAVGRVDPPGPVPTQ